MRYIAKFPVKNGEFVNSEDQAYVEALKAQLKSEGIQTVRDKFSWNENATVKMKKRVCLFFNGPRVGLDPGRSKHNCQSTCLKKNATEARVYIYEVYMR